MPVGVADFVHLHVHTEYSLLDGMIRIKDLVDKAFKYEMPAVAITDHGSLFGAVYLYEEARKKGLKPIIGCEVYVAPNSRLDRDAVGHHLVLLCKNYKGYQNLCKLVTAGYIEGFYYKPRVDKQMLAECNEGLIALSACLKGEIASALLEDNLDHATKAAGRYQQIFDNDRFFLEVQDNGITDQVRVNRGLIQVGNKLGIPLVATNDCHYLDRDLARAHEILLCLQTGKTLSDEKRMRLSSDEFYFRSPGEMKEKFAEIPDAITNSIEIANRCNLEWDFETKHFPIYPVPEETSLEEMLKEMADQGFEARIENMETSDPRFKERQDEYRTRLEYELKVIQDMGFSGYFLIVSDFVNWAKGRGISVGPGRGSAAGSLVSYCIGITDINPLAYGLIFERFLNPERREMPDIDVDFCQERREEVFKYLTEQYGGSRYVAQIITFGTMKAKAAVRDVGRVLDMPYGEVDRIAKMIPKNMDLDQAIKQEPRLAQLRDQDEKVEELLFHAKNLEGISRHASTHAAGVVISDKPLNQYLPLYQDTKGGEVVSQFDMHSVEKVGLIKFDLLGLKTLTLIRYCTDLIRENQGVELDAGKLPINDEATFELLGKGDTGGVFQLESSGMKDLLTQMGPSRFEELIAVVALYRPGAMASGGVEKFIERKHKRQKVEYIVGQMQEILEETYGVMLYQEQVMEIAVKLASYTMGEADSLRKAMGKKIPELMATQEDKFVSGAVKNKINEKKAKKIFDDMAQFAGYGFNKSHAAVYAQIAYQTAYLKAHYPVEFMAALLTMDLGDADKVMRYIKECEDKKIPVNPPHVNHSVWEFRARGDSIRFGLGAIKGLGRGAVEAIVVARDGNKKGEGEKQSEKTGPYRSLFDLCERVDIKRVNRRAIEGLIKGGAFDELGPDRPRMTAAIEQALEKGHQALLERESGQTNLFDMIGDSDEGEYVMEHYPQAAPWSSTEVLSYEKEALGFYLTGHPLARFEDMMKIYKITDTSGIPFLASGQDVLVGGVVTRKKETIVKRSKKRMAFITVTDLKGSVEVVVFADAYKEAMNYLESEELPLLIRGRVEISEDKTKILAGEIFPLEMAPEKVAVTIHIKVKRPPGTSEQVKLMGNILKAKKGRAKVVVHVEIPNRSETLISLPVEYRTNPDRELILALEDLLGKGAVNLEAA